MHLNDEARALIAAQYVLGVLPRRVRGRFAGMLGSDVHAEQEVQRWEAHLAGLAALAPERIPARALRSRVLEAAASAAREEQAALAPVRQSGLSLAGLWASLTLWRGLATASLAAAVFFGVAALERDSGAAPGSREIVDAARSGDGLAAASEPDVLSVLAGAGEAGIWLVKVDPVAGRLKVRVLEASDFSTAQAFELWLLPSGEGVPESLGLLPASDAGTLSIPGRLRPQLDTTRGLAVSIEPPGGSPTGLPTGPVVYSGAIIEI